MRAGLGVQRPEDLGHCRRGSAAPRAAFDIAHVMMCRTTFLLLHRSGMGYETMARGNVCLTIKRGRQWRRNRRHTMDFST